MLGLPLHSNNFLHFFHVFSFPTTVGSKLNDNLTLDKIFAGKKVSSRTVGILYDQNIVTDVIESRIGAAFHSHR